MPTYAYVCDECGEKREVVHSGKDRPAIECPNQHQMRKDIGAFFPHVSLKWHKGQGIGDRLVVQSARRHDNTTQPVVAGG
jgi:putative FmdB family regulatory protein